MSSHLAGFAPRLMYGALLLLVSQGALAQAVIVDHQPLDQAIPTLSSVMMIILSGLLALVAFRMLSKRSAGTGRFMIALLATGAVALGAGGVRMMTEANAVGLVEMTNPGGGSVLVDGAGYLRNSTGRTQRIVNIRCVGESSSNNVEGLIQEANFAGPLCEVGSVLDPGGECFIDSSAFYGSANNGGGSCGLVVVR